MDDRWFRLGDHGRYPTQVSMNSSAKVEHEAADDRSPWLRFSLRTMMVVVLLCGPTIAIAYKYWPRDIYHGLNYNTFVLVGALDPCRADHVKTLLDNEGIPNIIEGSVAYGVSVQPKHSTRALAVIQKDAASNGYWFKH